MATVYKRGDTWWVRFQWNGQEIRKSARTTSKGEAREYLASLQAQYRAISLGGRPRTTFDAAAVMFIEEHVSKKELSTIRFYQARLRVLSEAFSGKYLDEIDKKTIADFEARQAKRVSASTLKQYRATMSGLFRVALRHDLVETNPCRSLDPITVRNARYRFLSQAEWKTLRAALKEPLLSIAELSVLRGMRCGEILALRWDDLDATRDLISMAKTKGGMPRVIPMEAAFEVFKRQPTRRGLVFPGARGFGMSVAEVTRAVNQAARDAQIKDFTFHDLRHTFASWYVQNGGDMYRLQVLLGHTGPAMTQRYAHLRVEDLRNVAQKEAHRTRDFSS